MFSSPTPPEGGCKAYLTPGTPQYEWMHRYMRRYNRAERVKIRKREFPGAVIVPPQSSFVLSGLEQPVDLPAPPRNVFRNCILYYDTGVSIATMAKHSPILAPEQCEYGMSGMNTLTYYDERIIRGDRCWHETEEPGYRRIVLRPCYVGFSVSLAQKCEFALEKMTFGVMSTRHQSLRRIVMAAMLFHGLKKNAPMLLHPGVWVSSTKVGGGYAAMTYDSVRISLMIRAEHAKGPVDYSYPFGLAMGYA